MTTEKTETTERSPMLQFECAYFIVTGIQTWGRHVELAEAFKAAKIKPTENKINYIMSIFLFKHETPVEVRKNVLNCFYCNDWGIICPCTSGLTDKDHEDLKTLVGYTHYNNKDIIKEVKKKKEVVKA